MQNTADAADKNERVMVYGDPGDRARLAGLLRALWPLLLGVALTGVALGLVPANAAAAGGTLLLAALVFWAAARNCATRVRAFFKGARGEERVAAELARLPGGFSVFHGVDGWPGMRLATVGDVDHVVVGPSGLWVVETKCWDGVVTVTPDGTILFNGTAPSRDPLRQVKTLAESLASGLKHQLSGEPPAVRPLLCFAGSGFASTTIAINGIMVCGISRLHEILTADVSQLEASTCGRCAEALKRAL